MYPPMVAGRYPIARCQLVGNVGGPSTVVPVSASSPGGPACNAIYINSLGQLYTSELDLKDYFSR
jgi:hypothetical protein